LLEGDLLVDFSGVVNL